VLGHPGVALAEHSWRWEEITWKVMAQEGQKGLLTNGPFDCVTAWPLGHYSAWEDFNKKSTKTDKG
jgi:hypothetical protein